jgi:hypothetical protein
MKIKYLSCALLLLVSISINSQNVNRSLKIGAGLGISENDNCKGIGTLYSLGYQRDIWKDRLRFNPNLSLGFYSPAFIINIPEQYFNSINLNANLNFDVFRVGRFSFLVYAGTEVGIIQGYVGVGRMSESEENGSYYLRDFHIGGNYGGGFRINSKSKRTAINVLPLNFRIGYLNFMEAYLKLELDVKI